MKLLTYISRQFALAKAMHKNYLTNSFFQEIPVYTSNDAVYGLTGVKSIPGAVAINKTNAIFINEEFEKLPEEHKHAILCHEKAHIDLGHTENVLTRYSIKREIEADTYAVDVLGANLKATIEYLVDNFNYGEFESELRTRLNTLQ